MDNVNQVKFNELIYLPLTSYYYNLFFNKLNMSATLANSQAFIVGMFGTLLGENDLHGLEACVQSSSSVVSDLNDVIAQIANLDVSSIIKAVQDSIDIFNRVPQELSKCTEVSSSDMNRITSWAKIFSNPFNFIAVATGNYFSNMGDINNEVGNMISQFANDQFEDAGETYGKLLISVVGKLPPATSVQGMDVNLTLY